MDNQPLLTVADQVKAWAKRNQAIVQLADALERIGSIEQAAGDAEARRNKAQAECDALAKEIESTQATIDFAHKEAAETRQAALDEASKVKADAYAAAERMTAEATSRAKSVAAEAKAHADKITAEATAVAVKQVELARKSADEVDKAHAQVRAAEAELADINGRLIRAKAEAKRVLEG